MSRIEYNGIVFDSDLEVKRYKYLIDNNIKFIYQRTYKNKPLNIEEANIYNRRNYTPDFIEIHEDYIMITECKGYIMPVMQLTEDKIKATMELWCATKHKYLILWLSRIVGFDVGNYDIRYQRIKYHSAEGWVDYDKKCGSTRLKMAKEKINALSTEIKDLKDFKKKYDRFISYLTKCNFSLNSSTLSKKQKQWLVTFLNEELSKARNKDNKGDKTSEG